MRASNVIHSIVELSENYYKFSTCLKYSVMFFDNIKKIN